MAPPYWSWSTTDSVTIKLGKPTLTAAPGARPSLLRTVEHIYCYVVTFLVLLQSVRFASVFKLRFHFGAELANHPSNYGQITYHEGLVCM